MLQKEKRFFFFFFITTTFDFEIQLLCVYLGNTPKLHVVLLVVFGLTDGKWELIFFVCGGVSIFPRCPRYTNCPATFEILAFILSFPHAFSRILQLVRQDGNCKTELFKF